MDLTFTSAVAEQLNPRRSIWNELTDEVKQSSAAEKQALQHLGEFLTGQSRFNEAAAIFRLLITVDSENGFYHRAYGICCERSNRYDEAWAALETAIKLNSSDVYARMSRASIRLAQGRPDLALIELQVAQGSDAVVPASTKRRIAAMMKLCSEKVIVTNNESTL